MLKCLKWCWRQQKKFPRVVFQFVNKAERKRVKSEFKITIQGRMQTDISSGVKDGKVQKAQGSTVKHYSRYRPKL